MSDFDFQINPFMQQGWECPKCGRIYSPTTPMCFHCGGDTKTSVTCDTDTDLKLTRDGVTYMAETDINCIRKEYGGER